MDKIDIKYAGMQDVLKDLKSKEDEFNKYVRMILR